MSACLDAAGRELVYCDDTPGIGSDCRFAFAAPADGDYLIALRDANYEGGPRHRFRLRIGDFPVVNAAFPIGGKRGTRNTFTFDGGVGESVEPLTLLLPTDSARTMVGLRFPGGHSSGFVSVLSGDFDEFVAPVPNHTPPTAARIPVPASISGRFLEPGTRDFYAVEARQGDRFSLRGRTRSIGSPCDLSIQCTPPGGKPIDSKDQGPDEGLLEVVAAKDGIYVIALEDLSRGGGPGIVYRLEVEKIAPAFTLSVDAEKVDVSNGTFRLKVKCIRRDYDGAIALSLGGAAAGWELKNATISAGKLETDLEAAVPVALPGPLPIHFTVFGKAMIGGAEISRTAGTKPALKKLFPRLFYPPTELDGLIGVSVTDKK